MLALIGMNIILRMLGLILDTLTAVLEGQRETLRSQMITQELIREVKEGIVNRSELESDRKVLAGLFLSKV